MIAAHKNFHDPLDQYIRKLPEPDRDINCSRVRINKGIITAINKLTYDTFEIVIKCDAGTPPLTAIAGQYGAIKVPGVKKPRSYSFAKDPDDESPGEHTFFIRLVHGGKLSGWLAERDRTGEQVELAGPLGSFQLDASSKTMVCIAGGSGMSAIKAIVERACNLQAQRDCYFFYGARAQQDLYCQRQMQTVKDRWHQDFTFRFIPVLSEEADDSDWTGPRGFVTEYFKQEFLDKGKVQIGAIKSYFCGPPPMIDHGIKVLSQAGLKEQDIYYDKFEDSSSPAPVVDNTKCVLCDECLFVKPVKNCIVEATNFKLNGTDGVASFERIRPAHTSGLYYNSLYIDENECIRCFACVDACPHEAISVGYDKIPKTLRKYT